MLGHFLSAHAAPPGLSGAPCHLDHSVIQFRTTWTSNYFALARVDMMYVWCTSTIYVVAFLHQEGCMQCKGVLDDMVA